MGKIISRARQRERARVRRVQEQCVHPATDCAYQAVAAADETICKMQAGSAMTIRLYGYVAALVIWVVFCVYWIFWGL